MSKPKYVIRNRESIIGLLWENDKLGNVLVTYPDTQIDLNQDLEIWDVESCKQVNHVDLRDFLLETLPLDFIPKVENEE
jgi:hypothetical protein